jgi:regulator of protease activity HflC (stomatin/prohibitin superfamily)
MVQPKKIIIGVVSLFLVIIFCTSAGKLWENIDAGETVVIQDPFDGELHVYKTSGMVWQGWGKATHYKKSNQFWFNVEKEGEKVTNDKSIQVKWNDGGHATIAGSVRYDLPNDDAQMVKIHSTFGSQEALETALIKTNVEKAVYLTGPLMTSKESYAERRNDLIFYIEDQASKGVYRTRQVNVKEIDPITNAEKSVTKVEILPDEKGLPARQEISPITLSGIKLYNISINSITYDKNVEAQIATQQQATMQVQTAIAKAKEAEQRALTVEKEGEANAAAAKWEIEVEKAKLVTEAEAQKAVAELAVKTAELNKQKSILEGEGEAAKKRLVMQANGALEQKLAAWLQAQQYWANAFGQYQGNIVPLYQTGGSSGNGAINMMELMGVKAAKDLMLDLSNKK